MGKKTKRQPFTPRGPFVVARPFRWGGRDYVPGEDFETRRLAINQRRLQLLYDAKSIDVKGDYLPNDEKAETTPVAAPVNPVPVDLVAGEGEFLFDTAIHAVEKYEKDDWIADEEKFLVHISPNAAKRLKKVTEGKSIVTALEIVEWPEPPAPEDTVDGDTLPGGEG